jgi:ATP-dependent exoDNAse (exonuclease V) alpha subunit
LLIGSSPWFDLLNARSFLLTARRERHDRRSHCSQPIFGGVAGIRSGTSTPQTIAGAATIHKSQGSEYPAVIIPVLTQHYPMLQRNLLYTGVTRGKRLVVLVGQKKAIAIAVRNVSGRRRWSKLKEWLRDEALPLSE